MRLFTRIGNNNILIELRILATTIDNAIISLFVDDLLLITH